MIELIAITICGACIASSAACISYVKADAAYQIGTARSELITTKDAVRLLSEQIERTDGELIAAKSQIEDLQAAAACMPDGLTATYAGQYMCTAYCAEKYPHICGGNGITASGTKPTEGITAAADWGDLPAGTIIYIEGVGIRRIEDTGSAINGKKLDICVSTHEQALAWDGYGIHSVWILK